MGAAQDVRGRVPRQPVMASHTSKFEEPENHSSVEAKGDDCLLEEADKPKADIDQVGAHSPDTVDGPGLAGAGAIHHALLPEAPVCFKFFLHLLCGSIPASRIW